MSQIVKLYLFGIALFFISCFSLYHFFYVFPSVNQIKYLVNIEEVDIGMNTAKLDELLGKPYLIEAIDAPLASYLYNYELPEGNDGLFQIAIDSTNHVVAITFSMRKKNSYNYLTE